MQKMRRVIWLVVSTGLISFLPIQNEVWAQTNSSWAGLVQAISSNNLDQVKSNLRADPALANATVDFSDPPLVLAVVQTNLEIINALLDAGAKVNTVGLRRVTALRATIEPMLDHDFALARRFQNDTNYFSPDREKRLSIAEVLLNHGASVCEPAEFGRRSLLRAATEYGDGGLVDFLLLNQRQENAVDEEGNSVVHFAALWARTNTLAKLAEQKTDFDATNFAGLTPLQAVSRLPKQENPYRFFNRWPGLDDNAPKFREVTARLLIALGAKRDVFSAVALGWTNEVANLLSQNPEQTRRLDSAERTPLHWAVEFGEIEIARLLLRAGSLMEHTNWQGERPLDVAASKGRNDIAELLVKSGASVNRQNGSQSPLHWAAVQDNEPLLKFLLANDADPNLENAQGETALDLAAKGNFETEVMLLLAAHARFSSSTNQVMTTLHWATANGNTNLIALLLRHGADVRARNAEGKTPFLLAHDQNNFQVMEFLLAHGADINAPDINGNTALHLRAASEADRITPPADPSQPETAAMPPARSMMKFLLEHGANVNATNLAGETPLHRIAAKSFSTNDPTAEVRAWIQPLLDHHASLEARDPNGCNVFQLAVKNFNYPLVDTLLKLGANINVRDKSGATALHLILEGKHPFFHNDRQLPFVELLLQHGAEVNAADSSGTTPLHLISGDTHAIIVFKEELKEQITDLLLKHGANANTVDSKGRTPLHLACSWESRPPFKNFCGFDYVLPGETNRLSVFFGWQMWAKEESIPALLLTNGAHINVRDYEGNTPLHYAAEAVRSNTVVLLLQHHAERAAKNKMGQTPLNLAYRTAGGYLIIPRLQPPGVSGEMSDAVRRNDLEMVKLFLKDDPRNVNALLLWDSRPLHWACNEGHREMVELLLAHGAEVNPPPHQLSDSERMEEMNRIENHYQTDTNAAAANTNRESEITAHDDEAFPQRMLPLLSASPLQLALANDHYEIARLLIRHGAKVDIASAASLGLIKILRHALPNEPRGANTYSGRATWVFGFDASAHEKIQSGTLLHFAVRGNQPDTVEYLLKAGADVSMLDDEGRTPRELAMELKLPKIADLLGHQEKKISATLR